MSFDYKVLPYHCLSLRKTILACYLEPSLHTHFNSDVVISYIQPDMIVSLFIWLLSINNMST